MPHARVLQRVFSIAQAAASVNAPLQDGAPGPSSGAAPLPKVAVPLGLVSYKEWFEIIRYCVSLPLPRSAFSSPYDPRLLGATG